MPWLSIVMFVLSYFGSSKAGVSKGKAALIATAAAAGTYYLADPANTSNVMGISTDGWDKPIAGDVTTEAPATGANAGTSLGAIGTVGKSIVETAGSVAKSWGPVGTMGAVGAVSLLSGNKTWLWLALGVGAVFLLKG